jgi:hypothetical protein
LVFLALFAALRELISLIFQTHYGEIVLDVEGVGGMTDGLPEAVADRLGGQVLAG